MKSVMSAVPLQVLQWRKQTGAEMWDEMWEGVLHIPPSPNREHQNFLADMEAWLRAIWARPRGGRVYHDVNVAPIGGWPHDYRIPDLVLLTGDRFHIDRNEYFEGAPTVVVEICSPGDESYEKLPFYARLGVPEAWLVDRDTRAATLLVLRSGQYEEAAPGRDGWLTSPATGIQLRAEPGDRLALQLGGDPGTRQTVPVE